MVNSVDNYEPYYQDKLWALLPAVYRTEDSDDDTPGPLRELVNRIGVQTAILRRSIDRLWEDQSIETCDDWLIPYLGDLLATNLVTSLDARGQRLDVAKTIYYRRRKGTVALLEELAHDITGWDVRVVEFFRRMGRTRHGLDPQIGWPVGGQPNNRALQLTEGLVGPLTHTAIGGWADLRNAYGAGQAYSAFDEFFHTTDVRRGQGKTGWYNIPHLGVFVWRLQSFAAEFTTPVAVTSCPSGHFAFDPSGRQTSLFAAPTRTSRDSYGDNWVSPEEWQLPTPMRKALLETHLTQLYATATSDVLLRHALGVYKKPGRDYVPLDLTEFRDSTGRLTIFPELGLFTFGAPPVTPVFVTYHYGFSASIGAGAYDRRVLGRSSLQPPLPPTPPTTVDISGGGNALSTALSTLGSQATLVIKDSLTYDAVADTSVDQLSLRAENQQRPLVRLDPANGRAWTFTGQPGSTLVLDGLWLCGADMVLAGTFDRVLLTCCTLDPGNMAPKDAKVGQLFAQSVDERDLLPTTLWIEGNVRLLQIDRCITGPVRQRGRGSVEQVQAWDSILQSIPTTTPDKLSLASGKDFATLATCLHDAKDPLSMSIGKGLTFSSKDALVVDLNALLAGPLLYDAGLFNQVHLRPLTKDLLAQNPSGVDLQRLNGLLLEDAYPLELADLALGFDSGELDLTRCTVLGPAYCHRLAASECILDDFAQVEDTQHGCVRFCAWASGSWLPRQYESVEIAPRAPLFTARAFGQPGYAQLLSSGDTAIRAGREGATIVEGAQDGSEMGAFARLKNPIKERSLLIKYAEYMPLGLAPVIIHVT